MKRQTKLISANILTRANKIYVHMESDKSKELSEIITKHGAIILLMKPREHNLEEIFLRYYKEEA